MFKMGSIKSEIERFIGKNDFNVWRMRMKAILFQQGVKDALKDESELPVTMTAKEKSDIDEKAYHLIILALGDKALREFSEETTAKGVWNKLEQLYMQNSLSNRLYLKDRLYGFKMQEDRSIADNLDDFAKIVLEMSNIGIKVDDEDKAVLVLKSLPGLYSNFKETMKYGRKTLTLEEVQSALRSKELELKKKGSNGEGLSIRGRSDKRNNKGKASSRSKSCGKKKCYHCQKEGHFKRDCLERKSKQNEASKETSKEESNAAMVSVGYDSAEVFTITTKNTENEWVLNLGCTFHMCPTRTYFCNYQKLNGGSVYLGNNQTCKVIGIGTVKIRSTDGTIRLLRNLRHVPDLKRNLISLRRC